jgi:exosortase/archaeosortase family protein
VGTVREPPLFRVALTFLLLLGLFNGAYQLEKRLSGRILDLPYSGLVAAEAALVGAWILPIPVDRRGDITLGAGNTEVMVRGGCNGLEAIFLMASGGLAYPAPWRRRGQALLVYLPILFILNLLRVDVLLYVMAVHPSYIDLFHYQIGQGILVIFVFGFWAHYIRREA